MSYFDVVLETLQGIQKELKATRHAILHQTKLMEESKETPKEAAPAHKEITWQEAVRVLVGSTPAGSCGECKLQKVCVRNFKKCPENWEVPGDE
jgi:hypothetical protein